MLRTANGPPSWCRSALLVGSLVGSWSAVPVVSAQEHPAAAFEQRFLGEEPLPAFTDTPIQFGGGLTTGSDWSAPVSLPAVLDPTASGSLQAPSSGLQSPGPQTAVEPPSPAGARANPGLLQQETVPSSVGGTETRNIASGQQRDRSLSRAIAPKQAQPGRSRVRNNDRNAARSAHVRQLPSVLRLED